MYPVEVAEISPEVSQPPANSTHEIAAEDAPVNVFEWSSFVFIPGEFCAYSTPKPGLVSQGRHIRHVGLRRNRRRGDLQGWIRSSEARHQMEHFA
ncbi:hypothetical protein L596_014678 [Steinernema carpocapsae]|uniref:Uncharacterized protein n=1 Tax=Steinernema carpocapsae TaxID=34508 RepID=A0A4U5ND42_STECR|nr:hypothetical protein L596_014678 [Steinernema carpocapsae]